MNMQEISDLLKEIEEFDRRASKVILEHVDVPGIISRVEKYLKEESEKKLQIQASFGDIAQLVQSLQKAGVTPPIWLLEQKNKMAQHVRENIKKQLDSDREKEYFF